MKMKLKYALAFAACSTFLSGGASAALISDGTWDGWTTFADHDGIVGPGGGGETFDAQFLLYKVEGDVLSIGLQTGFDVVTGNQGYAYDNRTYWTGDIALSFDSATLGDAGSYEYAIDFGLGQCGWSQGFNSDCGTNDDQGLNDAAGIYQVSTWNNDVYSGHLSSSPFAMDTGTLASSLITNVAGQEASSGDFFRQVSFNLTDIGLDAFGTFDAHWTMSCGNDVIDGQIGANTSVLGEFGEIPLPATSALFGLGMLGLMATRRREKSAKRS